MVANRRDIDVHLFLLYGSANVVLNLLNWIWMRKMVRMAIGRYSAKKIE